MPHIYSCTIYSIGSKERNPAKIIDRARTKFSIDAKSGIDYLLKHRLIEDHPKEISNFLFHCGFLDKSQIGIYLAQPDEESKNVLLHYMRLFSMEEGKLENALRQMLKKFDLPGEAQQIDRLTYALAKAFVEATSDDCNEALIDRAHSLLFSMIILNTDLHNPRILNKISKETWIRSILDHARDSAQPLNDNKETLDRSKSSGLHSITTEQLSLIYESIKKCELQTEIEGILDYTLSSAEIQGCLWKKSDRFIVWNRRWCVIVNGCLYYFGREKDANPRGVIPLEANLKVRSWCRRDKYRFILSAEPLDVLMENADSSNTSGSTMSTSIYLQSINSNSAFDPISNRQISNDAHETPLCTPTKKSITKRPSLPIIKSAKYVDGQLIEGQREQFVFQCASQEEMDSWVSVIKEQINNHFKSIFNTEGTEEKNV